MVDGVTFTIENDAATKLASAFDKTAARLTSTQAKKFWELRALDHRIDTSKHFNLKGNGKYEPLSPVYAARKRKAVGVVPILTGVKFKTKTISGRLKKAVSGRQGATTDTLMQIDSDGFIHGTTLPYATYVQQGTDIMPARPFLLVDDAYINRTIRSLDEFIAIQV